MRSIERNEKSSAPSTHRKRSQCAFTRLQPSRKEPNKTARNAAPRAPKSSLQGRPLSHQRHQYKKVCNALAGDHPKPRDARPPRQGSESLRAAAPRPGKNRACAHPTGGRTQRFVRTGLDTQHADDSAVLNRSPIWPHDPRRTRWDTECTSVLNLKTRRSTG